MRVPNMSCALRSSKFLEVLTFTWMTLVTMILKKIHYLKRLVFLITFLAPLVYRAMPKTLGSSLMISLFSVVLAFHDQLYYAKNWLSWTEKDQPRSPLISPLRNNVDVLSDRFNSTLIDILYRHAPLKTRTLINRSNVPWFKEASKQRVNAVGLKR